VQVIRPGYVATLIGTKTRPGSASPPDSPCRDLMRIRGELDMAGIAAGERAVDVAQEIRDAYMVGADEFYVPVTEAARQGGPWRKKQDDRTCLKRMQQGFEWWVNGGEALRGALPDNDRSRALPRA